MSADAYDEMIKQIRQGFGVPKSEIILPTPLGPIAVENLTFLEGWRWALYMAGYPGVEPPLVAGGPPFVLANYTDEKGWLITSSIMFRSPYGTMNFKADDWSFSYSPFLLNIIGLVVPTAITIWNNVYNPATPLGPIYGMTFTPNYALPYSRQLEITLSLPAGAPVAATTVFVGAVGKIWIQDEATFLRSLKKFMLQQMTGRKIERYP